MKEPSEGEFSKKEDSSAITPKTNAQDWELVKNYLKEYLGEDTLNRWFASAVLMDSEGDGGVIGVKSDMHQIWIETNYMDEVRAAMSRALGLAAQARVVVLESLGNAAEVEVSDEPEMKRAARARSAESDSIRVVRADEEAVEQGLEKRLKRLGMNPELSFGSFVVGDNSQFAHAACVAVAGGIARGYNPLFIHGRSGMGKTHLMSALGQELIRVSPKAKVVYSTAENFTNEFIDAVRSGKLDAFRRKFRAVDVLLLDDVQFLSGKERSQEEFFHTFNALLNSQTQIVLTCDRPAHEIQTFEPRLISRFESGLTVELQAPAFETRVAILRRKMELWKVKLDEAVVLHIANIVQSNVRRLEGALTRVASYSFLTSGTLSLEKVDELLFDIVRDESTKQITVERIQEAVAEYYDIRIGEMTGRRRPARIAFPRQVAMFLARELTNLSLVEIGEAFGRRDHGTVIHAGKKVDKDSKEKPAVAADIAKLRSLLKY